ncbi:hypothetical protein J825_3984 [Acinetobacter baumannii 25691_2]|nr:hypothetical protein J825_3984 [Acinetobacter baumannii 25691_2]
MKFVVYRDKYLKWNKSHLKCFALIMLVIILKQTCNLSSASKALPIKCLPQSFYRRMQRFSMVGVNKPLFIIFISNKSPEFIYFERFIMTLFRLNLIGRFS